MWPCRNGFFSPPRLKHSLSEKLWNYNECLKTSPQRWHAPVRCVTCSKQHSQHCFWCLTFDFPWRQLNLNNKSWEVKSKSLIYTHKTCSKPLSTTLTLKQTFFSAAILTWNSAVVVHVDSLERLCYTKWNWTLFVSLLTPVFTQLVHINLSAVKKVDWMLQKCVVVLLFVGGVVRLNKLIVVHM